MLRSATPLLILAFGATSCSDNSDPVVPSDSGLQNDSSTETRAYVVLSTGQTKTYGDSAEITPPAKGEIYFGQDAQYTTTDPSFSVSVDGKTVSESHTGLIWQKTPSAEHFSMAQAATYCDDLALGGYDDWRVPSLKELFSISDFSTGWPYLDLTYFDLADSSGVVDKNEQYWSTAHYVGVTVEGKTEAAFGVNHATGHIKAYPGNTTGPMGKRVRCVRGAPYGINEFVDDGDGTISDKATGLMWMRDDSGKAMDWKVALAWAQAQNDAKLLGYTDWRLPNVKELQSIVDYARSPSATEAAKVGPAIASIFSCTPIKNEAGADDYPYYWTGTSAKFGPNDSAHPYAWYVAAGMAVNNAGLDFHGAGAVRFDTKVEGGPAGEGGERYYNYVRLVRGGSASMRRMPDGGWPLPADGGQASADGGLPPAPGDGGQPGLPVPQACQQQSDCDASGACPQDAKLGCLCSSLADGSKGCIPACSTAADCPQLPGNSMICAQGLCTPQLP